MNKRYTQIASLILGLSLIPNLVFAAWWNPLSWFAKTSIQVNATSSVATTTIKIVATTAQKIIQKKVIPTPSVPVTQTPVVVTPSNTTLCNGTYYTVCSSGQNFVCPGTGNAYCQVPTTPASVSVSASTSHDSIATQEVASTTIDIHDATCSWNGSDTIYTLPFSVEGPWVSASVQTRSTKNYAGTYDSRYAVHKNGEITKSELTNSGGFIFNRASNVELAPHAEVTYSIYVYDGMMYFDSRGMAVRPTPHILTTKTGSFRLPDCP